MLFNFSFEEILKNTIKNSPINNSYNHSYHNQKYELDDIIKDIIYVLKSGVSWRNIRSNIKWQSLIYHFNRFIKYNIFLKTYKHILKIYSKIFKPEEQILYTDTTFIKNNIGIKHLGRNKFFKNKKCFKLSFITDLNGIPMDILCDSGNLSEISFLEKHLKYIKNLSDKKIILMADKGYDSKRIRDILTDYGVKPIIPFNKRNTKNKTKIKHLSNEDTILYKKRIKIENTFSWIKKNKRITEINEKTRISYINFVYLAIILIISKRLQI